MTGLAPADEVARPAHGGRIAAAARRFPHAPTPWLDLSTGISPFAYPLPALPEACFTRLPEPEAEAALLEAAARRYGTTPDRVVAAPGTQILLPMLAGLPPRGVARVLGPTYAEHLQAARDAGHDAALVAHPAALAGAALATVVNPNNPDGRLLPCAALRDIAARTGLLVVDEAFADVAPEGTSMVPHTSESLVVLRSFGKFHGLGGLRLGFAIAGPALTSRLRARLGPWAVSGPAIAIGRAALADDAWAAAVRARLDHAAHALDAVLAARGLHVLGGTSLFRFVAAPPGTAERLAQAGILVRGFVERPDRLRIGIPPDAAARARLAAAL
jgi:cobalamin biosynthetic protein CobC